MPHSTTYAQLIEKASQVISIDISKFDIQIKFKLKTSNLMLVLIMTNDDADYFVQSINLYYFNFDDNKL